MKTIIIGAGAAGLTAAICAARNKSEVTVIEHEKQAGKKILMTGNGRCNITNEHLDSSMYYGDRKFVDCVLNQFTPADVTAFFQSVGLYTCAKNGYVYPMSFQAGSVLHMLRSTATELGVKIKTNNQIKSIKKEKDKFFVDIGIRLECDYLIIATGGCSFPKTGSDGSGYDIIRKFHHRIIEPRPALTALVCNDNILKKASGVRIEAEIAAENKIQRGELQITDYGISGIPVLNLSRLVEPEDYVHIDFLPRIDENSLADMIFHLISVNSTWMIDDALHGIFHEKLATVITTTLNIHNQVCHTLDKNTSEQIAHLIKNYRVQIQKRRGFDFAQVTAGGVCTDEINAGTMESKKVKNLYFAGEVIDVDGICGGYNLHFAWATATIAGGNCRE